jgi:hypothetical protein
MILAVVEILIRYPLDIPIPAAQWIIQMMYPYRTGHVFRIHRNHPVAATILLRMSDSIGTVIGRLIGVMK